MRQLANLVNKLCEFTYQKPEFIDIYNLCQHQSIDIQENNNNTKLAFKDGYVYLFKSGNYYKIGNSYNVEQRAKQIKTQMPDSLVILHTITTDDPYGIESYWHNRFKDKRKNGEWFELSVSDVRAFKKRKFQ